MEYLELRGIGNGANWCTILHTLNDEEVSFQQPICLKEDTTSLEDTAMIHRTI